jgi:2-polyprenyl-3-methyl-5-hydroxy-6-metoxy-1,4-benzoquinol methylase
MHQYRAHHGPRSSHQQIARFVRELNVGPVLDVGSAQGIIGQLLHDSGLEIDAVEPNRAWADAARPYYRDVFPCAIEEAQLPSSHYRVIVCGDVLEHTPDPVCALRRLRRYAAEDAVYLISLPNVAHVAVRAMLLFGYFPRMDRGILDRTHLHYYTRDTAEQMLREAGLRVTQVSATPVPFDGMYHGNGMRWLIDLSMKAQHAAIDLMPRLFAMQWLFVARHDRVAASVGLAATSEEG